MNIETTFMDATDLDLFRSSMKPNTKVRLPTERQQTFLIVWSVRRCQVKTLKVINMQSSYW